MFNWWHASCWILDMYSLERLDWAFITCWRNQIHSDFLRIFCCIYASFLVPYQFSLERTIAFLCIRQSVCLSVRLSVRPYSYYNILLCKHHQLVKISNCSNRDPTTKNGPKEKKNPKKIIPLSGHKELHKINLQQNQSIVAPIQTPISWYLHFYQVDGSKYPHYLFYFNMNGKNLQYVISPHNRGYVRT